MYLKNEWIPNQFLYKRNWSDIDKIKVDASWVTPIHVENSQGWSTGAKYRMSFLVHSIHLNQLRIYVKILSFSDKYHMVLLIYGI